MDVEPIEGRARVTFHFQRPHWVYGTKTRVETARPELARWLPSVPESLREGPGDEGKHERLHVPNGGEGSGDP